MSQKVKTHGNGSGYVYKRGKTYTACKVIGWKTVVNNGVSKQVPVRIYKGGFPTKRAAYDYIPQMEDTKNKRIHTLATLWETYSNGEMMKISKSKQGHYKTANKKLQDIAYTDIANLTIDDLQRIIDEKTSSYYPAKDIKNLLSHLYDLAIAQQAVTINLSEYLTLPDLNETEAIPFSEEEIKKLQDAFHKGDTFTGYVLVMIYTGMMPGELFDLKTELIDLETQMIFGAGKKTKQRKVSPIILPDAVLPIFKQLIPLSKDGKLLPMCRETFYDEFARMKTRHQLNPELKPYSCRHTTATALKMARVDKETIKDIMRHANVRMTEHYMHGIDADRLVGAANLIDFTEKGNKKRGA